MCNFNCHRNAYKLIYCHSRHLAFDITTEQKFRYMELIDAYRIAGKFGARKFGELSLFKHLAKETGVW